MTRVQLIIEYMDDKVLYHPIVDRDLGWKVSVHSGHPHIVIGSGLGREMIPLINVRRYWVDEMQAPGDDPPTGERPLMTLESQSKAINPPHGCVRFALDVQPHDARANGSHWSTGILPAREVRDRLRDVADQIDRFWTDPDCMLPGLPGHMAKGETGGEESTVDNGVKIPDLFININDGSLFIPKATPIRVDWLGEDANVTLSTDNGDHIDADSPHGIVGKRVQWTYQGDAFEGKIHAFIRVWESSPDTLVMRVRNCIPVPPRSKS